MNSQGFADLAALMIRILSNPEGSQSLTDGSTSALVEEAGSEGSLVSSKSQNMSNLPAQSTVLFMSSVGKQN